MAVADRDGPEQATRKCRLFCFGPPLALRRVAPRPACGRGCGFRAAPALASCGLCRKYAALGAAFGLLSLPLPNIAHHAQALPRNVFRGTHRVPACEILRGNIVTRGDRAQGLAFAHAMVEGAAARYGGEYS